MNLSKLFVAVMVALMVTFTPVVSGIYSTATGGVTIVNEPGVGTQDEEAASPAPQFNAFIGKAEANGPGWVYSRLYGWVYVGQYVQLEYQSAARKWNYVVNYTEDPYVGGSWVWDSSRP